MAINRWITNLESLETMEAQTAQADHALKTAKQNQGDIRSAQAMLDIAKFKEADVKRAMAQIKIETGGRFTIGEPMATKFKTREEIAAQGIIGIYREGAGDGA